MWRVTAKGTLRTLLQVTGLVLILLSHKRARSQSRGLAERGQEEEEENEQH